jgi:Spy/CpxP family protein refolding chaperone
MLLGAGLAGIALASLTAHSWSGERGGIAHHPERMMAHMAERLDLDAGQQQKIEQILEVSREQMEPYREELRELREQLEAMSDSFDPDKARVISDRIGVITGGMVYEGASTRSSIRELLTDAQKAQLEELMEKREARRDKWRRKREE